MVDNRGISPIAMTGFKADNASANKMSEEKYGQGGEYFANEMQEDEEQMPQQVYQDPDPHIQGLVLLPEVYSASVSAFMQHYDSAQDFLAQGQYSSAIVEFRKALRINYMDNSARIGLINSYLARATYYANQEKNYDKCANDLNIGMNFNSWYHPNLIETILIILTRLTL